MRKRPAAKRRRIVTGWVTAGVLSVAGLLVLLTVSNAGQQPSPVIASGAPVPAGITATPAPPAPATPPGELSTDEAADVLKTALSVPIDSVATGQDLSRLVENVAMGSYASELEAQWQELGAQQWSVSGSPEIVDTKVISPTPTDGANTVDVIACLDSSKVIISDLKGDPVGDTGARLIRALHKYTLVQREDGVWRISEHSFPDDPAC